MNNISNGKICHYFKWSDWFLTTHRDPSHIQETEYYRDLNHNTHIATTQQCVKASENTLATAWQPEWDMQGQTLFIFSLENVLKYSLLKAVLFYTTDKQILVKNSIWDVKQRNDQWRMQWHWYAGRNGQREGEADRKKERGRIWTLAEDHVFSPVFLINNV